MSLIKFLKWAIEAINFQMANFFWDDQGVNIDITYIIGTPWPRKKSMGARYP
jgi:hypothetical protein